MGCCFPSRSSLFILTDFNKDALASDQSIIAFTAECGARRINHVNFVVPNASINESIILSIVAIFSFATINCAR